MVERVEKKVESQGGKTARLTQKEQEIYTLLTEEFLTPLQVALRRGISDKAVYAYIKKIKKKGFSLKMVERVEKSGGTIQPPARKVRVHGQHFLIKLLPGSDRRAYDRARSLGNVQYVMDCMVKLHRESIEVIAGSGLSFFGGDAFKATAESMAFWTRFFHRLENHIGVSFLKPRAQNIRLVRGHYALLGHGMERMQEASRFFKLYAREDGKVWFLMDRSFNLHEAETVHPETAAMDMAEVVEPRLNDWRDNASSLWLQSDLQRAVQVLIKGQADLELAMQGLATSQRSLSEAVTGLAKGLMPPRAPSNRDKKPPFYIG